MSVPIELFQQRPDLLEEYKREKSSLRKEMRAVWDKIILVSGGTIGFSASVIGATQTSILNVAYLKASWIFFAICILFGLVLLLFDNWYRGYQVTLNNVFQFDMNDINMKFSSRQITERERNNLILVAMALSDPSEKIQMTPDLQTYRSRLVLGAVKKPKKTLWWFTEHIQKLVVIFFGLFFVALLFILLAVIFI